jgi:hypothetical protein
LTSRLTAAASATNIPRDQSGGWWREARILAALVLPRLEVVAGTMTMGLLLPVVEPVAGEVPAAAAGCFPAVVEAAPEADRGADPVAGLIAEPCVAGPRAGGGLAAAAVPPPREPGLPPPDWAGMRELGVAELEAAEAGPVPTELVAATVKV